MGADLDWHASTVKPMREQRPLAQQPLIARTKFDLGDRNRVPQVKRTVHIGEWEASEPFGMFLLDLCG